MAASRGPSLEDPSCPSCQSHWKKKEGEEYGVQEPVYYHHGVNRGCFPPTDPSPLCRGGLRGLQAPVDLSGPSWKLRKVSMGKTCPWGSPH